MKEENGIYLFGIIRSEEKESFGPVTFDEETTETYTVNFKEAAAVVAPVSKRIFTPNRKNLTAHQGVISGMMKKEFDVVPVSFGNVFRSEEDVNALLENLHPELVKLFPEVHGKIEVGLKVTAKKEWLEELTSGNETLTAQKKRVDAKSKEAGYFDRMKLGEMAANLVKEKREEVEKNIHSTLESQAVSAKSNEPSGEKMLLNGAYLIEKEKEEAFDEAVNELHEQWKDKVDFHYTGPWPAYNFINMKLKVEN
ncbi:GvpL/GvpF family gas vesicle protein [Salimicrobium album]|uniref:Gas vesicle synthesis protein GvpL/GvpF n=1 Tax=Salimicrobium album TaxID=50717 RepID=A0A1H3FY13_9BACI|nr:GvpL/GvpF family gas vesicle protein [Salimicrobium album]SDX95962.1 Gas vesicle synthesis protein GvpL/GvpF [Salimicrobium album]